MLSGLAILAGCSRKPYTITHREAGGPVVQVIASVPASSSTADLTGWCQEITAAEGGSKVMVMFSASGSGASAAPFPGCYEGKLVTSVVNGQSSAAPGS